MSAAGLLAPAPAPAGAPPAPEYYPEEDEELESAEDDERSCRGRESDEDTEDASETDLAKHDEEDYVEMKEQMYQDKLASLKRQLQQLQEGTLQEYQKRMKKLDQQYKERIRNAELFLQLETEQVERNYIKEKKAAVKEFEDKKVELKENLIAELEEKKKMIENEKLTMELTGDSMEVKPIMTRKLRRRPNDPVPIPDKRRKPAPAQLNYLLTDEQIMEDLRTLNKLKSPKRPASPSSPEHLPATPAESPAQRFEARIEDGKLYYDKRWYHKSQAIYLESKDNQKLSCVISSVGANEIWVRKTSDSTKMRIYLGQLQRGLFVIRRRRTPSPGRECQQNGSSQHQSQADRNVNSISKLTPKALSHDSLKVSARRFQNTTKYACSTSEMFMLQGRKPNASKRLEGGERRQITAWSPPHPSRLTVSFPHTNCRGRALRPSRGKTACFPCTAGTVMRPDSASLQTVWDLISKLCSSKCNK
ncbi:sin3 histone deacetylase corepressor complex component SDS3 isoform X2 [Sagmatias obliquidens]|uniref:sin3 histone deacetylase corepressor complex component SDS3 isoform X2 n=1 Tax=Sagmatias obliquidens TaxID=3371155 RepID=UPI000F442872|nr:sin3 histone deacetylase corepressor complex component SDS3 isoform X2 [Lagenorhynchus obliquidens]